MKRAHYQSVAKDDLVDAWLHIAQDSISRADQYLEHLQAVCELIAENPLMGTERSDIAEGVRAFPVDQYVIYYEPVTDGMNVLRVWHSSRDPAAFTL